MGILWTLATMKDAVILEFGCMGHSVYFYKWLDQLCTPNHAAIYATHISEKEIAFGDMERLKDSIHQIEEELHPKYIFLLPSSVPEMIGMDLEAFCMEMESEFNAKLIHFKNGGFKASFYDGVEEGLFTTVKQIAVNRQKKKGTYSVIGSCADYAHYKADLEEVKRIMSNCFGYTLTCALSSDTTIDEIEEIASSEVVIVLRQEGLKCANYLEKQYGIPFCYQSTYGLEATLSFCERIKQILQIDYNRAFLEKEEAEVQCAIQLVKQYQKHFGKLRQITICGPYDAAKGISNFMKQDLGLECITALTIQKNKGDMEVCNWDELYDSVGQGLYFANYDIVKKAGLHEGYMLSREYQSYDINPYHAPFLGFRGVLNLCELLFEFIQKEIG